MSAADPAARAPHSLFELGRYSIDMFFSRFCLLDGNNPANPFIARERCQALPCCKRLGIGCQGFSQIGRQFVCDTTGNFHSHTASILIFLIEKRTDVLE